MKNHSFDANDFGCPLVASKSNNSWFVLARKQDRFTRMVGAGQEFTRPLETFRLASQPIVERSSFGKSDFATTLLRVVKGPNQSAATEQWHVWWFDIGMLSTLHVMWLWELIRGVLCSNYASWWFRPVSISLKYPNSVTICLHHIQYMYI